MKNLIKPLATVLFATTLSAGAANKQQVSVAIQTPSSCEQIQITDVYAEYEQLLVVAKVFKPSKNAMCMMMISNSSNSVTIENTKAKADAKEIKVAILGKDWCWDNTSKAQGYIFVKNEKQLKKLIGDKTKVFSQSLNSGVYYQGFEAGKKCEKK